MSEKNALADVYKGKPSGGASSAQFFSSQGCAWLCAVHACVVCMLTCMYCCGVCMFTCVCDFVVCMPVWCACSHVCMLCGVHLCVLCMLTHVHACVVCMPAYYACLCAVHACMHAHKCEGLKLMSNLLTSPRTCAQHFISDDLHTSSPSPFTGSH